MTSAASGPKTDILFFTATAPNGYKVSAVLEELGLTYETKPIALTSNTQKEEWFLKINPNGRIPAIIDRTVSPAVTVFESGAIMMYLVGKYDPEHRISYPHDSPHYWQVIQWLFFQNAGVGPMQGQATHFHRYAPEKVPYAIERYRTETLRLYSILERRLAEQKENQKGNGGPWLVGDKMTIADLSNFPWVAISMWSGVPKDKFPLIQEWEERIKARTAIQKALTVPNTSPLMGLKTNEEADAYAVKQDSSWILKGMKEESDKHK